MKIIIAGSRSFQNYKLLKEKMDKLTIKLDNIVVISGHALGTDRLGERWAWENGFTCEVYHPDYTKYGKEAPIIRNKEMCKVASSLVAFWDQKSLGTRHIIEHARKQGLQVKVIKV